MLKKISTLSILIIAIFVSGISFGATLSDGIALYNAGKYNDAINVFNTVIRENSNDAVAYHYKGLSYVQLKKDLDAIQFLTKAISINASYTKPYMDAIMCYERLGEYDNALAISNKLISADASYKDVYYEQGRIYSALGKYSEAIASFKKQRSIDASTVWGTLYLATGFMIQGDYDTALTDLTLIEKFDSNKFNTAMIRAIIQEKSGNKSTSQETLRNAKDLFRDNKTNTLTQDFNLAWYDYKSGNYSKAIQSSTRDLINKSTKPSNGYFNLARIFADRGQFSDAVIALKRAIYFDPNVKFLMRIDPILQSFNKSKEYKLLDDVIILIDGVNFIVENATDIIPTIVKNDTIMVPVLSSNASPVNIFERLGAQFSYSSDTRVMTIVKGSKTLKFDLKSNTVTLNGKKLMLNQNALIQGNFIYIPLEDSLKQMGITYSYNSITNLMDVNYFSDVPRDSWYSNELGFAANKGIVKGFSDNTFRPTINVTVDQFIVMTLNAIGYTNISASSTYWAQNYIDKALELGFVKAYEFSNYKVPINREQAAAIISRALKLQTVYNLSGYEKSFVDFDSISQTYKVDVLKTYSNGILTLNAGYFNPKGYVNRASAVVIITKLADSTRRTPPVVVN